MTERLWSEGGAWEPFTDGECGQVTISSSCKWKWNGQKPGVIIPSAEAVITHGFLNTPDAQRPLGLPSQGPMHFNGSSWTDRPPSPTLGTEVGHLVSQPPGSSSGSGFRKQEAASPSTVFRRSVLLWVGLSEVGFQEESISGATQTSGGRVGRGPGVTAAPRLWTERGASAGASWAPGTPAFWGPQNFGAPCAPPDLLPGIPHPGGGHADVPSPASSLTLTSGSWGWQRIYNPELLYLFGSRRFSRKFSIPPGLDQTTQISKGRASPLLPWEAHSMPAGRPLQNAWRVEQTGLPDRASLLQVSTGRGSCLWPAITHS